MNDKAHVCDRLRETTLFREFTQDETEQFVDLLDREEYNPGDCIVRQDETGDCMYLVVAGSAQVVHHQDGRDVQLAALKSGDFFGELALVDKGPRSADVEAIEKCVVLRISQAAISALAGVYPTAAFKFLIAIGRIMVERLRQSNRRYIDSMLFPLAGKD